MKNPFQKQNNTTLIAAVAVGAITIGALTYLLLTENGSNQRKKIKKTIKKALKSKTAEAISKKTIIPKKAAKAVADLIID